MGRISMSTADAHNLTASSVLFYMLTLLCIFGWTFDELIVFSFILCFLISLLRL